MHPSRRAHAARSVAAAASYVPLSCVLTWPLPLYLRTRLLGDPGGDTGVYVWNLWIFRHELIRHAHLPFSTDHIFGATGSPDFSLHNYAPVAGVLGAPLVGALGVVAAFNVVMLTSMALTGMATFLLARRLGLGRLASWWAGAFFMASPVLTAKETAHFSLVLAAPLPLFLWALVRVLDTRRTRDAVLVGAFVALATYSDAYYGIFCVLIGVAVVAFRFLRLRWPPRPAPWPRIAACLDASLLMVAAVIAWRAWSGPARVAVGPVVVSLQTWYNPLLLLVLLGTLRAWLSWRPSIRLDDREPNPRTYAVLGLSSIAVCLLLLLPQLAGIAMRFVTDQLPETRLLWRTSPAGLDALAYLVPNPSHAWFGETTRHWFAPEAPDAFPEYVASFSFVALALAAVAAWYRTLPRQWVVFTALFVALSLGPFVHVAGVNTYVIGPWALLRYVPIIGMARSPARFAIVAALGLALLAAYGVEAVRQRRTLGPWVVALLAVFELVPAPRSLYSAAVPQIYQRITATAPSQEKGRLLELPTGIRDGTSSVGNFSALSLFFQTSHRRPLVGGYLSRVSRSRRELSARMPMYHALLLLSEGRVPSADDDKNARRARDAFLRRTCSRFVMIDKRRASDALRAFAVDSLGLTLVEEDGSFALFTPVDPPACTPATERRLSDVSRLWAQ